MSSFHRVENEENEGLQINRPRGADNQIDVIQNIEENNLQRSRRDAEFDEDMNEVLRSSGNNQATSLRQQNRQQRINAGRTVLDSA